MLKVGFQNLRSGRDLSPDSVIFTGESNLSMFSSASASVDRCSFASDPDSVASAVSQKLVGHERSELIGGGPDPGKPTSVNKTSVVLSRKEKSKVLDASEAETTEDDNSAIDSARNSFSRAVKECQERRLRSEVVVKKTGRPRLASVELHNSSSNTVSSSSPRAGLMRLPSSTSQRTGWFPSPGTPIYSNSSVVIQKGWSSERVPLHRNMNRRNVNGGLMPCNNGRTLPSKWEDAERWIFSPVSVESSVRTSFQQPQQRPKSKSGPLGPPGVAYYQMFSPAVPSFERGSFGKMAGDSPISAGAICTNPSSALYRIRQENGNLISPTNPCITRSISIHGCGEIVGQSALPGHEGANEGGKYNGMENAAVNSMSIGLSRKDMATQMSPENSSNSSPERTSSFSIATPSVLPLVELHASQQTAMEEHVTMSRWSKKSWIISAGASKSISKAQREEARIAAWENLQKAKAEASIRKLEMELEKKRASSMEMIMNKLRGAQRKAQQMRSSMMDNQAAHRNSDRTTWRRRILRGGFFSRYFTCHAS